MQRTLITAPTLEPLTVQTARSHVRVTTAAEDDLLAVYLQTARERVEAMTRRQLMLATWELQLDELAARRIYLPRPPLLAVTSVKYLDLDLVEQTVSASTYRTSAPAGPHCERGWVELKEDASWPTDVYAGRGVVRIRFTAGYSASGDAKTAREAVPAALRSAILLTVAELYDQRREAVVGVAAAETPLAARRLCWPFFVPEG